MGTTPINYDALAKQNGGQAAQAGSVDYDALAAQHGGSAVSSDQNQPTPPQPPPQEGFLHSLGSQFGLTPEAGEQQRQEMMQHPIRTGLKALAGPALPAAEGLFDYGKRAVGDVYDAGKSLLNHNPTKATLDAVDAIPIVGPAEIKTANQVSSGDYGGAAGTLLGSSAQAAAGLLGGLDSVAPGRPLVAPIRPLAIGNPDAAALRGLQVGPKSPDQLSKIESIHQARPFVAGAKSQADMQARLPPVMNEVWTPYREGLAALKGRPIQGPEGITSAEALEAERMRLSALNRGVRNNVPSALQEVMQQQRTPAQLIEREEQFQRALDPHLESVGIKPGLIRQTYGSLADVRSGVEGKTTLNEKPQPSGFGRMMNLKATEPRTFIGEPMSGLRDILAGRPWWSAKPTDLGIREGFAQGGPKPNFGAVQRDAFGAPRAPAPRGLLGEPTIELGAPPERGGTPEGYRPPPFYHDTTPMRTGRLLKAPPIQLGGAVEGPKGPPVRYDTTPMRQGRILPPPTPDTPLSSHADIFPEQRPGSTLLRKKTIEGKK